MVAGYLMAFKQKTNYDWCVRFTKEFVTAWAEVAELHASS